MTLNMQSGSAGSTTGGSSSHEESSPDSRSSASAPSSGASGRRTGRCKWFNVLKGFGFLTPDDGGAEVFVHQSVLKMEGFRSLDEEEHVEFESKVSDKGHEATLVTGIGGAGLLGSHIRPLGKKKYRKIRCFNCGEFGTHLAKNCRLGQQPKCCYECKSTDHMVANCPLRHQSSPSSDEAGGGSPPAATTTVESPKEAVVPPANGGRGSSGIGSSGSSDA